MSEAKKLQHRVAMAFQDAPASAEDAKAPEHSSEPIPERDASLAKPASAPVSQPEKAERDSIAPYVLIAGGLFVLMLALSVRINPGYVILAVCLGAGAIAAGLYAYARQIEAAGHGKGQDGFPLDGWSSDWKSRAARPIPGAVVAAGSLHDAFGDLVLSRTLDGVILSANRVFREVTGQVRPEGRTCEELRVRFRPLPTEHCYDVDFATPAGVRTFFWQDVVMRDPAFGDLVIQSVARDVTADRVAAAQREQARLKAEEESDRKSRLIATVSHEIRTPLSGLLGMGHLLAGTRLSAEQSNYLDGIRQSGAALVHLVEDLLDFSTITAGRFQLHPREEAIRPLIESTVEMLSSRAHAKGIEIGTTISAGLPEKLTLDPGRFRQVLYNLIGNAVKFTETGGVLVSACMDANTLLVRVTDSGPGMNEAETQRIFGEFEQGNLSRLREGGVGLGLAISARIMAAAGGGISVESRIGEGSTFQVRLPVELGGGPMRSGGELVGARILLLAPQGPAATALSRTVAELGAGIVVSSDIGEALAALDADGPFSAIIVDHRLDKEFSAHLNRSPKLAGAKRIFLVNPEARPARMSGSNYDSWLIRPLREQSLIDVLTGKLRGLEPRQDRTESFPSLPAEPTEEQMGPRAGDAPERGLSILVGEDDPVNAMISQALLERSGHRVRLTESFGGLTAALAEGGIDLVLTDYSMPDGTCEAFIEETRGRECREGLKRMPVIVLTGDGTDETRRTLLTSGADLVLVKPAGPKILNGAIEHLCRARLPAISG